MKAFLSICILFHCVIAFADISRQEAHGFALQCSKILRSGDTSNSLESFIVNNEGKADNRIGWLESFWFSETNNRPDYDLGKLNVDQVLIRDPDSENPAQIELVDYKIAKCLLSPEKIAVVYLGNVQKNVRAVIILPLVFNHGQIMLCPMLIENAALESKRTSIEGEGKIPIGTNLSNISGVEITKVADDNNSFGFSSSEQSGKDGRTFDTNPSGCALAQIVLHVVNPSVRVKGLDCLPSGRFRVHCQLLAGESGTIEDKFLNEVARIFGLNIRKADACLWDGYQVIPPNPLPDCFEITTNSAGQSAMHGSGDYEGYSLNEILSNALHKKPFELHSTNTTSRYNVRLEVWPEAKGERAALEKLGFRIIPCEIPLRTLIVDRGH